MNKLIDYEKQYWDNNTLVLGVDEVATGNLFGPMYIAGVCFPILFDFSCIPGLKDSKQLKDEKRFELEPLIQRQSVWSFCEEIDAKTIDKETAHHAKLRVASKIIRNYLETSNADIIVIMDGGFSIPNIIKSTSLVKGDSICKSIAAASILAKCAQRRFIISMENKYAAYNIGKNNGYWSESHAEAIKKYGPTDYHRATYLKNIL